MEELLLYDEEGNEKLHFVNKEVMDYIITLEDSVADASLDCLLLKSHIRSLTEISMN